MRAAALIAALLTGGGAIAAGDYAAVPGASFRSVLPPAPGVALATVERFGLQRRPVTNAQFLAFVNAHPEWRRDRVAGLFAESHYLQHWPGPLNLAAGQADAPVVHVSWFAATAYCEAQGARLPRWHEWEWAAAADETRADAREDPAWRQRMLDWYARTGTALDAVGRGAANLYGVQDLHGLVWEWTEDFGALMVSGDNREQGDPDLMKFCGSGALSMEQKENYAVLMRIAMLSSVKARYTTASLGFRCARTAPQPVAP